MFLLERHERISLKDLAAFVQDCMQSGVKILVISRNDDGQTCTVSVQRE